MPPGALDGGGGGGGGAQCRVLNLGNGHNMLSCHMLNFRKCPNLCHFFMAMLINPMSHFDFKKWPCRSVKFRGQAPSLSVREPLSSHLVPPV